MVNIRIRINHMVRVLVRNSLMGEVGRKFYRAVSEITRSLSLGRYLGEGEVKIIMFLRA